MSNAPPPPAWPDRSQANPAEIGRLSGFWIRVAAYLIDGLIVLAICLAMVGVFVLGVLISGGSLEDDSDSPVLVTLAVALVLAMFAISWLYEALLTSSPRGATLGKQAVGIRIVRSDGAQLSFGRASARHFLKFLITPLVPLLIGYLMAAFTARKQALHDLLAETLVIEHADGFQHRSVADLGPNAASTAPSLPAWNAQSASPGSLEYGGFWLRVVAYLVDVILLLIAAFIIGGFLGFGVNVLTDFWWERSYDLILLAVLSWIYFSFMESSPRGATVGKMAVGLRVVTEQGRPVGFANATGRYFAKFVSWIVLGIGFIMAAFTDRKRGLHDMIAGTLVIKTRP